MKEITPKSEEITIKGRKFIVINSNTRGDDMLIHSITADELAFEKLKSNSVEWKAKTITDELKEGFTKSFSQYGVGAENFKNYYEAMFAITKLQFLSNILTVISLHDENGKPIARSESMIKSLVSNLDFETIAAIREVKEKINKQGEDLAEKN